MGVAPFGRGCVATATCANAMSAIVARTGVRSRWPVIRRMRNSSHLLSCLRNEDSPAHERGVACGAHYSVCAAVPDFHLAGELDYAALTPDVIARRADASRTGGGPARATDGRVAGVHAIGGDRVREVAHRRRLVQVRAVVVIADAYRHVRLDLTGVIGPRGRVGAIADRG